MTVGSLCSGMPIRSRLLKTADTRVCSAALPVSFWMMEASVTDLPYVQIALGRARAKLVVEDHPELRHHRRDEVVAGGMARQQVGLREQVTLEVGGLGIQIGDERNMGRRRRERLRGAEPLRLHDRRHLRHRQPLGESDRPQVNAAVRNLRHRGQRRYRSIEEVTRRPAGSGPARCAGPRSGTATPRPRRRRPPAGSPSRRRNRRAPPPRQRPCPVYPDGAPRGGPAALARRTPRHRAEGRKDDEHDQDPSQHRPTAQTPGPGPQRLYCRSRQGPPRSLAARSR